MITDLEKLASLRVDRASDNRDIKPVDLLRAMVHDIESGRINADGLILLYVDNSKMNSQGWGHSEIGDYRCGITIDEQLAALARLQHIKIHKDLHL